ncbi:MAG: glycosyltransferase [Burkholderiales bacterium]|nr:glycosyltransferase [Burkholderiales bacterium]
MKLVLLGDGESPHLLKWARALAPRVTLFAASSRGFAPALAALLPAERRLSLGTRPAFEGGNVGVLRCLPRLAAWLRQVQPDWVHAHYLTSHGTLAWAARALWRLDYRIAGSAWGSDILVTPQRSALMRMLTRRVLRACSLCTSDSQHMAAAMRVLGAGEVMTFPFGLEALPPLPDAKQPALCFANRGLEPIYAPERVLAAFEVIARAWPEAELVVANEGSLQAALVEQARASSVGARVRFVGRLDAQAQATWYARARWYLSLPRSDSVSVSVLEAMAHGCIPLLSDLPANRELVRDGDNGLILRDGASPAPAVLQALAARAETIALGNHEWVARHALFAPAVERFVARLEALQAADAGQPGRARAA